MAVVEKHALDGANTITLMKHKRRDVIRVKSTRMGGANYLSSNKKKEKQIGKNENTNDLY